MDLPGKYLDVLHDNRVAQQEFQQRTQRYVHLTLVTAVPEQIREYLNCQSVLFESSEEEQLRKKIFMVPLSSLFTLLFNAMTLTAYAVW